MLAKLLRKEESAHFRKVDRLVFFTFFLVGAIGFLGFSFGVLFYVSLIFAACSCYFGIKNREGDAMLSILFALSISLGWIFGTCLFGLKTWLGWYGLGLTCLTLWFGVKVTSLTGNIKLGSSSYVESKDLGLEHEYQHEGRREL